MQENILDKAKSHFNAGLKLFHDCNYLESEHDSCMHLTCFLKDCQLLAT